MPDRAVVDVKHFVCLECSAIAGASASVSPPVYCYEHGTRLVEMYEVVENLKPQPHALCAVSEDRQWLVGLSPAGKWIVSRWTEAEYIAYVHDIPEGWTTPEREPIEDTGQDAHEVLAAWLEGRGDEH